MTKYGVELVLDMRGCDVTKFNRRDIRDYCNRLCELIGMQPEALHFWDDVGVAPADRQTSPKTKGTTAIQFILTSNITVHTLDLLKTAFVNIFSCKEFDTAAAEQFTVGFFSAQDSHSSVIDRGAW